VGAPKVFEVDGIQERGSEYRWTEYQVEALLRFATLKARSSPFSGATF
jgi:hypothetical protein